MRHICTLLTGADNFAVMRLIENQTFSFWVPTFIFTTFLKIYYAASGHWVWNVSQSTYPNLKISSKVVVLWLLKNAEYRRFLFLCTVCSTVISLFPICTGAPCDNFRGYCDVFQKCRAVNEDGPLARLKNLLFNQQTINEIRDWITVCALCSSVLDVNGFVMQELTMYWASCI